EEDLGLTPTLTHSQLLKNLTKYSPDQLNQKVTELVQYLLVKDQKKIPIKRADILKKVIREYRDVCSEIISRANKTLQEVFGLQLVEVDTKHHIYILINNLPPAQVEEEEEEEEERKESNRDNGKAKLGLLMVILSFIFMKGNSAKDGALWEFLRRLRVQPGERHEVFGDVKKLLTEEFVRQKYLEITPTPMTDPPEFTYQWGPRAAKETSKRDVLHFVAKV
ncbi:NSE3 protein, partial [Galbula dea]|nr:NSE3 protein [Galbula dea]